MNLNLHFILVLLNDKRLSRIFLDGTQRGASLPAMPVVCTLFSSCTASELCLTASSRWSKITRQGLRSLLAFTHISPELHKLCWTHLAWISVNGLLPFIMVPSPPTHTCTLASCLDTFMLCPCPLHNSHYSLPLTLTCTFLSHSWCAPTSSPSPSTTKVSTHGREAPDSLECSSCTTSHR